MPLDDTPVFEPTKPPPEGEPFTLEKLQDHLQSAIYVEMCTIPLYLYAYYSIKPNGQGDDARDTIKSVFKQEMLHLALASNTLYALGKAPILYSPTHIPDFPKDILFTPITMNLRDGRRENIKTFVDVEAPSKPKKPPTRGPALPDYKSIGDFYEAIKKQLVVYGSSIKKGTNQISDSDGIWYDGGLTVVSKLDEALSAMELIIEQGEGTDHDGGHYKEFYNLWTGSANWEWYPVVENPKTDDYEGKIFYEVLCTFDAAYCYLVSNIERLYRVSGNTKREICSNNILAIMRDILGPLAEFILGERIDDNTVAGPPFNYYPLDSSAPLKSLKEEIEAAIAKYAGDGQKKSKLTAIQSTINQQLKDLPAAD